MLKSYLKPMALAVVASALVSLSSATAAPVTWQSGDLLMGFRITGGTDSFVINLGAASTFRDATSSLNNVRDIGANLVALFGNGWATDSAISWGIGTVVVGAINSDTDRTIYLSKPGTDQAAQSTTGTTLGGTSPRNALVGQISNFQTGTGGFNTTEVAANTGGFGAIMPTSQANDWAQFMTAANDFNSTINVESNFSGGTAGHSLDLYRYTGVSSLLSGGLTSTYEGTFGIDSNGVISYSTGSVPEPSTYALMAIAGIFLLVLRRRNAVATGVNA